jgi:hypothetical protein
VPTSLFADPYSTDMIRALLGLDENGLVKKKWLA